MRKIVEATLLKASELSFKHPVVTLCILGAVLAVATVPLFTTSSAFSFDIYGLLSNNDSPASRARVQYAETWGAVNGFFSLTITPNIATTNSTNVLQKSLLLELLDLELALRVLVVTDDETGTNFSFNTICLQPYKDGRCMANTVLDYWHLSKSALQSDDDILRSVSRPGATSNIGTQISPSSVMGGIARNPSIPSRIATARWLSVSYVFDTSEQAVRRFELWRVAAARLITNTRLQYCELEVFGLEDIGNAYVSAISSHVAAPICAVLAFLLLCSFAVSIGHQGSLLHSIPSTSWKACLTFFFLLLATASITASLGFLCLCGVQLSPFTAISALLPALLVVAFCTLELFSCFRQQSRFFQGQESLDKCIVVFSESGLMLVAYTALTALLCLISSLPGIRLASAQLAITMIAFGITAVFGFPALASFESDTNKCHIIQDQEPVKQETSSLEPLSTIVAWVVVIITIGVMAASIAGMALIQPTLNINTAFPVGSASAGYLSKNSELSTAFSLPFMLFFTNTVQHNSTQMRAGMLEFDKALQALPCVNSTTTFWYNDFIAWTYFLSNHSSEYVASGHIIPEAKFAQWLHEFLDGIGKPHSMNVIWESSTVLRSSRILGSVTFDINTFSTLAAADTSISAFAETFPSYINGSRSDLNSAALAHSPVFGFSSITQAAQRNLFIIVFVGALLCLIAMAALVNCSITEFASATVISVATAAELCAFQSLTAGVNAITLPIAGFSVALSFGATGFARQHSGDLTRSLLYNAFAAILGLLLFVAAGLVLITPFSEMKLPLLTHYVVVPFIVAVLLAPLNASLPFVSLQFLLRKSQCHSKTAENTVDGASQ